MQAPTGGTHLHPDMTPVVCNDFANLLEAHIISPLAASAIFQSPLLSLSERLQMTRSQIGQAYGEARPRSCVNPPGPPRFASRSVPNQSSTLTWNSHFLSATSLIVSVKIVSFTHLFRIPKPCNTAVCGGAGRGAPGKHLSWAETADTRATTGRAPRGLNRPIRPTRLERSVSFPGM